MENFLKISWGGGGVRGKRVFFDKRNAYFLSMPFSFSRKLSNEPSTKLISVFASDSLSRISMDSRVVPTPDP